MTQMKTSLSYLECSDCSLLHDPVPGTFKTHLLKVCVGFHAGVPRTQLWEKNAGPLPSTGEQLTLSSPQKFSFVHRSNQPYSPFPSENMTLFFPLPISLQVQTKIRGRTEEESGTKESPPHWQMHKELKEGNAPWFQKTLKLLPVSSVAHRPPSPRGSSSQPLAAQPWARGPNLCCFPALGSEETLTDVRDWDGGRLPVAFGLLVVGWLSFSVDDTTESKPSRSKTKGQQIFKSASTRVMEGSYAASMSFP